MNHARPTGRVSVMENVSVSEREGERESERGREMECDGKKNEKMTKNDEQ